MLLSVLFPIVANNRKIVVPPFVLCWRAAWRLMRALAHESQEIEVHRALAKAATVPKSHPTENAREDAKNYVHYSHSHPYAKIHHGTMAQK